MRGYRLSALLMLAVSAFGCEAATGPSGHGTSLLVAPGATSVQPGELLTLRLTNMGGHVVGLSGCTVAALYREGPDHAWTSVYDYLGPEPSCPQFSEPLSRYEAATREALIPPELSPGQYRVLVLFSVNVDGYTAPTQELSVPFTVGSEQLEP